MLTNALQYKKARHTSKVGEKEITVQSFIPVFSDEKEQKSEKDRIEHELFDIFSKYMS